MDRHYGQHYYRDYENVERVEPDCQVVETKTEDYLCKVRTQDPSVIRQRLAYVNGQLSSDVEDQVIPSVGLDYHHHAENNPSDPEKPVQQLVPAGERLA